MADLTLTMPAASTPAGAQKLTLADLKNAIHHALGKTTLASTTSEAQLANEALMLVCSMHPWWWRDAPLSIVTTPGQSYIDLPSDFGEMRTGPHTNNDTLLVDLVPATMNEIVRMRATTLMGTAAATRYCIVYVPGDDDLSTPHPRIEVWPTPGAAYTITGTYLRVPRKMIDDGDVPDLPAQFHTLLKRVVRAHALDEDDQQDASNIAWDRANKLAETLKATDGRADSNLGIIRGGVRARKEVIRYYPQITLGD